MPLVLLIGLLLVGLTVVKRAAVGPQPQFARSALALFLAAFIAGALSTAPGDFLSHVGSALLSLGLLVAALMSVVETWWSLKRLRSAWARIKAALQSKRTRD